MRKKLLGIWVAFLSFFAFSGCAFASVSECHYDKTYNDPAVIYVASDGTGDFNCDGTDDDVEINEAFQTLANSGGAKTSVFLKSGTYVINHPVIMVSNAIFEGDKDAVLKLKDQAGWTATQTPAGNVFDPLIGAAAGSPVSNVEIKCFEVDVNYANNFSSDAYDCYAGKVSQCASTDYKNDFSCCENYSPYRTTGKGYYNVAYFANGSGYSMHDMYLHDGLGDGFKILKGSDIKFYDNTVYKMGHEGLYALYSQNVEAYGNKITARTNSGVRTDNTNNVSIHNNDIEAFDDWSAGGPGIEIVKDKRANIPMNNIQVYENVLHNTYGPGIQIVASGTYASEEAVANIHHNIFYETGMNPNINWVGGIVTSGFYNLTVENNVFDKVYNGGLVVMNSATMPSASGYVVNFRNNIINNTQPIRNSLNGGYGVSNSLSDTHTVNSQNNCFYQNSNGDYSGTISASDDMDTDPLLADSANHDYHLKSKLGRWNGTEWVADDVTSPCVDAGYSSSDYSKEPYYNGNRINIGRYGNTEEASKSPLPTYALAVDGGGGTGAYEEGTKVNVTADVPTGKTFAGWTGDTAYVSDVNSASAVVSMPNIPITLTATYNDVYYNLEVASGSGSGSYVYGQNVDITADAPQADKVFDRWIGDTQYVSDVYSVTAQVVVPDKSISLTATYKDVYYDLNIAGGLGSGSYISGQLVTVSANAPAAGTVFDKWTGGINYISDVNSASAIVAMPSQAITLTATYKNVYALTVSQGSGSGSYAQNQKIFIVASKPAAGKVFSKWTGDTAYVSSVYSSSATVTMPAKAITLTATYKTAPYYYLTVKYGKGSGSYYAGYKITVTANAPAAGKVFYKWIGDTAYISNIYSSTATVTMPAKAITLTATYKAK